MDLHPAFLRPGTSVGPWRLVGRRGRGSHGIVYRAAKEGQEPPEFVSLKIALTELEPHFEREVALLSRLHHPAVPSLRDSGVWRSPGGVLYPYIVLEWVEGTPLYDWAAAHEPSSCQVARLLAQVAGALAATHVVGGLPLDIHGDTTLVTREGERVVLTGLGASHHAYRSPEAWQLARSHGGPPRVHDGAQPRSDVFALGVMAYRLVTAQYPPPTDPSVDGSEVWHGEGAELRPPRELNPRVSPRLDALILKMLAVEPDERGTARELAEALEELAESEAPRDTRASTPPAPAQPGSWKEPSRVSRRTRWVWLSLAGAAVAMPLLTKSPPPEFGNEVLLDAPLMVTAEGPDADPRDGGKVDLGDGVPITSATFEAPVPYWGGVFSAGLPLEPLPGQRRPPCLGTLEILGGCWMKHDALPPDCPDFAYEWRGACYVPILSTPRPSSSDP
ncbi:protein kinase domain-containing protein [Hyalangium gracile]|uniref:protein kinase domain-containing protein n=1 Tax=Hyalangium gracile TaxID=394092 RepID=UPI001CCE0F85|nr:protein kinase [Hyalangium gracile]